MRAIGYTRVSTAEQADGRISLDAQRRRIEGQAAAQEYDLVEVIEDPGFSAKNTKRPGLARLMALVESGAADVVIITKLDRLSRNVVDLNLMVESLAKHDVGLVSLSDPIDTVSATGRMQMNILACLSQWEREIISERTQAALDELKAQGKRAGALPYGYAADADNVLIENPEEQATIAAIAELRDEKISWGAVAEALTARGMLSRAGTPFSRQGLHRLAKAAGLR